MESIEKNINLSKADKKFLAMKKKMVKKMELLEKLGDKLKKVI